MVLPRRSIRHRPGNLPPSGGPRLLPETAVPPGREGWTLAVRARALRLSADMVAADLADLGASVPSMRLRRVMLGVEPADPALLAALVEVLQLRDRALSDEQVLTATAGPWLSVGQRVPASVAQMLADARSISVQQVLGVTAKARARRAV
jgi:hypothetical protein